MARPVVNASTEELYAALGHLTDGDVDLGWPLLTFLDANTQTLQYIEDIVRDDAEGRPGWSILVDIDRAPADAYGFLGQFVGVQLLVGLDDVSQNLRIRTTSGQRRGTPDAIKGAAQQLLTGTRRVDLFERESSPYRLRVRTFAAETPNPTAVAAALAAEKPAGLVLVYDYAPGMTYAELQTTYGPTYGAMTATGRSYANLASGVP